MYAYSENFVLPLSHDEVVHIKGSMINKMSGDLWQRFANLRAFYGYMWGHPGKKLLFMGAEFGQWSEWNYKESLDWHLLSPPSDARHAQLLAFLRDLNHLYLREPALSELDIEPEGFSWIDPSDSDNSVISFQRRGKQEKDTLVFITNFTPIVRYGYRLGVPRAGEYRELINSDASQYGGSGVLNSQSMNSDAVYWQSCPQSILVTLPPLATVVLKGVSQEIETKSGKSSVERTGEREESQEGHR
jgi:1,4-alpha-glucan branching enzyme